MRAQKHAHNHKIIYRRHSLFFACSYCVYRLAEYDGRQPHHPLLLAIKGRVLDVRGGADFYGPDGPYKVMSGRDASKGFAMMSLKVEDAIADVSDVPEDHIKILDDWYDKLTKKYPTVGILENNTFGYKVEDIDIAAEALKTGKGEAF